MTEAALDEAGVLWELHNLAEARRLVDWTTTLVCAGAVGKVAEVGAGIGTYSRRLLAGGATDLLLVEPEPRFVATLNERFAGDPRVAVVEEELPAAPSLRARAGTLDAVVCQNVLEHIEDDRAAVATMAAALRPGGVLSLQVPAHPSLYNGLDRLYGHHRRYTRTSLRGLLEAEGLEVRELRSFNLLGVLGWWAKRHVRDPRIGRRSLRVYETLLGLWRPVEDRLRPSAGLGLIAHAAAPRD